MRPLSTAAYLRAPEGAYAASSAEAGGALAFCVTPDLYGGMAWGRHGRASADKVCALLDAELRPEAIPHDSLFDVRRVTQVDPDGFLCMREYLVKHAAAHARLVRRQVLLRPAGFVGAVAAGFYEVLAPQYPVHLAATAEEAARWLGRPEVVDALAEMDRAIAEVTGGPTRSAVRALLHEGSLRLSQAAQKLGLSERTLQRRLEDEGSSWNQEAQAARVERAKLLLAGSDEKIAAIAREIGCATPQSFASLFRRLTGLTPSDWRNRHRR
jgi:AraC-like DNA-binding protein